MTTPQQQVWWQNAVVYQIYPRSFQDSDGDGEGDLPGVAQRLDHVARLGADALWLSPVYPSPMADGGYDVSDYRDIDPRFGSLADADALIAAARARGLRLLMDLVPSHTSIEHPWFRDDPGRYIWSDRDGPANNWVGVFGGSAWSRDQLSGRWYLHTFFPEQPDLDWHQKRVRAAFTEVLRFWVDRGVAGFRLDAINCLMKDPELRDDPPAEGMPPLPHREDYVTLEHCYSHNAPDIGIGLRALREGAGKDSLLVGEVYLPSAHLAPYLEYLDIAFCFELMHATWHATTLRRAIENAFDPAGAAGRVAWVLSNHDSPRVPDRVGHANVRTAAILALTLPGVVFVYQGDEIGMPDGPGREPPDDRVGRDRHRHPMRWDDDAPHGGFTTGDPWLPAIDVVGGAVAQQERDPDSVLALYRDLIALRRGFGSSIELLDAGDGVLAYRRGSGHVVVLNLTGETRPVPRAGSIVRATHAARHATGDAAPDQLEPGEGFVAHFA